MSGGQDLLLNQQTDARTNHRIGPLAMECEDLAALATIRTTWASMPMIPRVLADRNEGIDNSFGGLDIRTLLIGEESAGRFSIHDVILRPGATLPPHHLPDSDSYWYVVEGEVELTIGDRTELARRDAFGYAPQDTTQAIRNRSGAPARAYLWYSPAGPERAFALAHKVWLESRGSREPNWRDALSRLGFVFHESGQRRPNDMRTNECPDRLEAHIHTLSDFMDLRAAWSNRPPAPKLIHGRSETEAGDIPLAGQDTKVLLSGDEGAGRCVVFNYGVEPNYRAPPHHQPTEEEIFFIIEGELRLTVGNLTQDIPRCGFGFIPRNATHGFVNPTDKLTRTITLNSPAGHERGFEMVVRDAGKAAFADLVVAHGWRLHDEEYAPYQP